MERPAQIPCPGACIFHLHSEAGEAWLLRHACPFPQSVGPDGISYFLVTIGNNEPRFLSAHEIHTYYFQRNIASFERRYGRRVQNVVANIPASINPRQYQSELSAAAAAAGVHIVHFIERSVLAASYYESFSPRGRRTVLVFELGGQILEISLLTDQYRGLNIKAAVSDLGCPLFNHIVSVLTSSFGNDFTCDADFLRHIRTECERAKDALCLGSGTAEVQIQRQGMEVWRTSIDREWLVELNLNHLRSAIMRCLTEAAVWKEDVNEVVLAGVSSTIPAVQRVLYEFFPRQPFRFAIDPANLINLSFQQCLTAVSNTLNTPVASLTAFNLGLYSL
ncbi:hypothetical protein IEQ34_012289 [Dendrobium chrysotoxum]|uniref:Heat shock protein 70 n=1 Tax=Dendrobium chrysotoxum TaxID=161865 RepID=A0AAV7GTS3_DENCH|nr:hypothetical protein IEQ34_012289 [Dendrobium chrysotoxum]